MRLNRHIDRIGGTRLRGSSYSSGSSTVSYDADAALYFAAHTTPLSGAWKAAVNTLVLSLKADSNWTPLDMLHIWQPDEQGWRVNLKTPATVATAVNSPTFGSQGFTGDGATSYLELNINPFGGALNYQQNSCHFGVWVGTNITGSTRKDAGAVRTIINSRSGSTAPLGIQTSTLVTPALSPATSVGHTYWERTGAGAWEWFKDGVSQSTGTDASQALSNSEFVACAYNTSTTGTVTPTHYSTRLINCVHSGSSAIDPTTLYTALNTFRLAVAGL